MDMGLTHMSKDPVPEEPKTRTQVPLPTTPPSPTPPPQAPVRSVTIVASIAAGLSLLTPYVQLLGIPHRWASYIWLCGPISGLLVQPIVGHYSDHCSSGWGRRRPFIACGVGFVALAVILIGFAADIGGAVGDPLGPRRIKKRAIAIFVVGFWILDVANNMLHGPCRAFLADLAGYAAGSFTLLHKLLPFSTTSECDLYCANLKTCFLISILLLLILASIALISIHDKPLDKSEITTKENGTHEITEEIDDKPHREAFILEIFKAMRNLSRPMWILLLVTCLNWLAWFPFLLFDTDWMGEGGVRWGGQSGEVVWEGWSSEAVGVLGGWGWVGVGWGVVVWSGGCEFYPGTLSWEMTLLISNIPFAQAAIFSNSSGSGQGSGPWDSLFGGGNLPAFVVGAVAAVASGVVALTMLPSPAPESPIR
ncbi:sucrose transporter-like protein [Cinnamomum micranthum f. kanehirae]|uniref:Sucrose transporter-like protein n=1 Tax=Cinnamomum micranthum f. kanehirae TaxID=337451 RepID=A0A3S3MEJ3_9MAGN|nr:sucrose transporter-like protein [Cinnamomum micranthum f. kanehirae]